MKAPLIYWKTLLAMQILLLSACGNQTETATQAPHESTGQVKTASDNKLNFYAASRVADQVSFGATPALVAELQAKGLTTWLDQQFVLALTPSVTPQSVIDFVDKPPDSNVAYQFAVNDFWANALTAPDQLRRRVGWALFQVVPANSFPYGRIEWRNLLQRHAFGNYGDFLYEVSIHPVMGDFLNNVQNRPRSDQCLGCTPNENYARELMQLFSLGVVQLNIDGTPIRDAQGKVKETYTQKDVEELARALTGWRFAQSATKLPNTNWNNVGKWMEPEEWRPLHDFGEKVVMGTKIAAGGDAPKDLRSVITMLMKHPNIAPLISLRLIQHLVTSDPSPAYIARVAKIFRDNGSGITGDMKATIRAILTDAEARKGDQINADTSQFGKFREPVLWHTAALRGLNCRVLPKYPGGDQNFVDTYTQQADSVPSVFAYYQATDRAPGSNLLAPEQKIISTMELTGRLGKFSWINFNGTGCENELLGKVFAESPKAFIDFVSNRWFRGAMPSPLRNSLNSLSTGQRTWDTPEKGALTLLQYALATPYFGVMK